MNAYEETMTHTRLENVQAANEGEKFKLAFETESGDITQAQVTMTHFSLQDTSNAVDHIKF